MIRIERIRTEVREVETRFNPDSRIKVTNKTNNVASTKFDPDKRIPMKEVKHTTIPMKEVKHTTIPTKEVK